MKISLVKRKFKIISKRRWTRELLVLGSWSEIVRHFGSIRVFLINPRRLPLLEFYVCKQECADLVQTYSKIWIPTIGKTLQWFSPIRNYKICLHKEKGDFFNSTTQRAAWMSFSTVFQPFYQILVTDLPHSHNLTFLWPRRFHPP